MMRRGPTARCRRGGDIMSNTDIVRRFFDACEAKSLDGIMA